MTRLFAPEEQHSFCSGAESSGDAWVAGVRKEEKCRCYTFANFGSREFLTSWTKIFLSESLTVASVV